MPQGRQRDEESRARDRRANPAAANRGSCSMHQEQTQKVQGHVGGKLRRDHRRVLSEAEDLGQASAGW